MSTNNIYPSLPIAPHGNQMEMESRNLHQQTTKKVDENGDGQIELHELQKKLPHVPPHEVEKAFIEHDRNRDGVLDRHEYRTFVRQRAYHFANMVVVPRNQRRDQVDGEYTDEYTCMPPPIFMFAISLIEIGVFGYHTWHLIKTKGWVGVNGPAPVDSVLIYSPYRRYEAWRYLTYMLVHSGWVHLANNIVMQLFLGVLLEMVHRWWRVLIVYFAGVIAGSLATSITDPGYYLAGASGGVYALITAHMATVILNWSEMELPWIRVLFFSAFCTLDVGLAVYNRYLGEEISKVGYAAHFGGALAGLLIGIHVLRNLNKRKWEKVVWRLSIATWVLLAVFAVSWNIFYSDYFPDSRYGPYGHETINTGSK